MLQTSLEVDYPYFPFRISIDYVLVHDASSSQNQEKLRHFFEKAAQKEGLIIKHESSGRTHFTLVSTPFHRLLREAELSQMCFPLKDCQIRPDSAPCCFPISKIFVTDDTVSHINAPFQRKNGQLFLNYTNEKLFFSPAQRGFLTHQILTKIDISKDLGFSNKQADGKEDSLLLTDEPLRRKGLNWMLMKNVYDEAFVLHQPSMEEPYFKRMKDTSSVTYADFAVEIDDDPRRRLSETWGRWLKFQPLNKIRDYFGEQIAYYFAWQGTFITLLWPATIFGLVVFVYGFVDSVSTSPIDWNQCNNINLKGEVENVTLCEFGNELSHVFDSLSQWFMSSFDTRMNAFFAVFMAIWGSVFVQIWKRNNSVLSYQWNSDDFHAVEPDRPEFRGSKLGEDPITGEDVWMSPMLMRYGKLVASFLFVSSFMLLAFISLMLVTLLKIWLAHYFQCETEYTVNCWMLTAIVPSVLNTLSTMGLGAIYSNLVEKLNRWENHRTESDYNNALIVKIFAFQMVNTYTSLFYVAFVRPESHGFQTNGLFGLGESFKDTCIDGTCGSLLAVQLLAHTLIKPVPKFTMDVVLPYFIKIFRIHRWTSRSDVGVEQNDDETNVLIREWLKPDAGDFVLWEMNEKIIMFGTTMMFASLFPLAPLFALIIGFVDMRIDAHRLVWFNRKPTPQITTGIGIWLPILTFLQYCAVFTNAFIVAFTSGFCSKFFDDGEYCSIQNRLIIVIVFQNIVFVLRYLLSCIIPSTPATIKLAKRKKRYVISHILEKGDVPHRTRAKKKTRIAKIAWITSNRREKRSRVANK